MNTQLIYTISLNFISIEVDPPVKLIIGLNDISKTQDLWAWKDPAMTHKTRGGTQRRLEQRHFPSF